MKRTCEKISQMLVDFTDGNLSSKESNEVASHIAMCENCRRMTEALRKTLRLSKTIWEDNIADLEPIQVPVSRMKRKTHWLCYAGIAACILLAAAIYFASHESAEPVEEKVNFAEIERKINDSASAARLLAATELLAEYPDAKMIVEQQYHYIVEKYE
jgi:anti-sigma factor RsiW